MKRILQYLGTLAIAITLFSCSADDVSSDNPYNPEPEIRTAEAHVMAPLGHISYIKLNGEFIPTQWNDATFQIQTYDVIEVKLASNCAPNATDRQIVLALNGTGVWSALCEGTFILQPNQYIPPTN